MDHHLPLPYQAFNESATISPHTYSKESIDSDHEYVLIANRWLLVLKGSFNSAYYLRK